MNQPFSDPAQGDRLQPRDIVGQLLIIHPTEYIDSISTAFVNKRRADGTSDAIKVDVVTLDMVNPGNNTNIWRSALWFQSQLILGLRPLIGGIVLGRMAHGQGKPGQNPPFVIESASKDTTAVARAQAYLAQHPEFLNPGAAPTQQTPPQQYPTPPQYQQMQQQYQQSPQPNSQQSVLERLQQQAQQPFPVSGQPFQNQAPF